MTDGRNDVTPLRENPASGEVIDLADTPIAKHDPGAATEDHKQPPMETDSEVEFISPSAVQHRPSSSSQHFDGQQATGDDDEIQMMGGNTTNANIDMPHMRSDCGLHKFVPDTIGLPNNNLQICSNCYCFVCDIPASECKAWGQHCHAHPGDAKWKMQREARKVIGGKMGNGQFDEDTGEVTLVGSKSARTGDNQYQRQNARQRHSYKQVNEFLNNLANNDPVSKATSDDYGRQRQRARKDMRIPEVLLENFRKTVSLQEKTRKTGLATEPEKHKSKMEGDLPNLRLHNFFMQGIKIGWPYPEVMKPQKQMALHLVKALKSQRHVVLESPTGTGKSAAILCTTLAWQRYQYDLDCKKVQQSQVGGDKNHKVGRADSGDADGDGKVQRVKIIYCSRTHSQVAQMVQSLRATSYRPRMAILGSRERLCIHKSIKPRNGDEVKGVNVNNECRTRVRNTEKARKHRLNSGSNNGEPYIDDDPPEAMPGDGDASAGQQDGQPSQDDDGYTRRRKTCPHYRQLTTTRVANLINSSFVPGNQVNSCCGGGKASKFGSHDIEDLVGFGVDPYVQKDVTLYRKQGESWGLQLGSGSGVSKTCVVRKVKPSTPADTGLIQDDDRVLKVNGHKVDNCSHSEVVSRIKADASDQLVLDVARTGSLTNGDGTYSERSACPYYMSQVLAKDADLIFAPYNYVLDPSIREVLGIELSNAVVVLDEAHNVESTLREAGSLKVGEFELCEIVVMLGNYSLMERSTQHAMEINPNGNEAETAYLPDVAHVILLFVEKLIEKLRTAKVCFEKNPGKKGASMAIKEWEKYRTADDTEFDILLDGPSGHGQNGKPVGCKPFFDKLGMSEIDFQMLEKHVEAFNGYLRGQNDNEERDRVSNLVDKLTELVSKLSWAAKKPEHYYTAVVAVANGSLAFASGQDEEEASSTNRFRRKPRSMPFMGSRTKDRPNAPLSTCKHEPCRHKGSSSLSLDHTSDGRVRHGYYCDGSTPKWECQLNLDLLTPGPLMQELAKECRSVVLASGSLAPLPSLCAELNLFPAESTKSPGKSSKSDGIDCLPAIQRRLQVQPRPLEADHVVNLEKQLFALSIGHFPDGSELRVSQKNYSQEGFLPKLGDCIVRIVQGISEGGVLVFLPSYSLLRKCERAWNPDAFQRSNRRGFWRQEDERESVWERLVALKSKVIVESGGSQDEFEMRKQEYMDSVKYNGGCVLIAVYRGKMSEGISFNDNNARGVICVGLPLPSAFALPIKIKMHYNDEQRKLRNRTDLLPGREWYNQQAYRAIAQALGRCIRHSGDYGAVFLLDSRHCDDGSPNNGVPVAHKNLPKWMRGAVRNLSMNNKSGRNASMFNYVSNSNSEVLGGWNGLKKSLQQFYKEAKPYVVRVLAQQNAKMEIARGGTSLSQQLTQTSQSATPSLPSRTPARTSNANVASLPSKSNQSDRPASNNGSSNTPIDTPRMPVSNHTGASHSSSNQRNNVPSSSGSNPYSKKSSVRAKTSETKSSSKKRNTLAEMFEKQSARSDAKSTQRASAVSSSNKRTKRSSSNNPLKTLFEKQKQRAASSNSPETIDMTDGDPEGDDSEGDGENDSQDSQVTETQESELPPIGSHAAETVAQEGTQAQKANLPQQQATSFEFKRSPFSDEPCTQAGTDAAANASQMAIGSQESQPAALLSVAGSQAGPSDGDQCVICEDEKKSVMLLPCKHMCLCRHCATTCLDKLKTCPICRRDIEDSMEVFW